MSGSSWRHKSKGLPAGEAQLSKLKVDSVGLVTTSSLAVRQKEVVRLSTRGFTYRVRLSTRESGGANLPQPKSH